MGNFFLGEWDWFNDMYYSLMFKLFDIDNSVVEDKWGNFRIFIRIEIYKVFKNFNIRFYNYVFRIEIV